MTLVDIDAVAVEKAQKRIANSVQRVAKKKYGDEGDKAGKFISDTLGRIIISVDAATAVGSTDLVVEAIVENLEVKKKLFAELDKVSMYFVLIEFSSRLSKCLSILETTIILHRMYK